MKIIHTLILLACTSAGGWDTASAWEKTFGVPSPGI